MNTTASQKFTVFVNDNYHYKDEDERYKLGGFKSEVQHPGFQ